MMRFGRVLLLAGALAITSSGCTLYGWGNNDSGSLGDGTLFHRDVPTPVARNPDWVTVDAGSSFACGISEAGNLYCWGSSADGRNGFTEIKDVPTQLGSFSDWSQVSAGEASGCAIRAGGILYCWGYFLGEILPLTQIGTATDWISVSAGGAHTCGIRRGGALYCWGDNTSGQLGDGTTTQRTNPKREVTAATWLQLSAGLSHTCAIRSNRSLHCWGNNTSGQLGDGTTTTPRTSPVQEASRASWRQVSAGFVHTCGIRTDRTLYCWGDSPSGQLGDGTTMQRTVPTQEASHASWTQVSTGADHTCGIQPTQYLYCWGNNEAGQLGIGTADSGRTTPTLVTYGFEDVVPIDRWVSVSAGGSSQTHGLRDLGS
jgi:alpha-tubulin suppressor-like RCC1 family protein